MRAVVTYQHGGLDQMIYEPAYRDPVPGPGDVILRVRACTLNYHDVFTRKGMPGIKIPMPLIMGIDVAGEVVETGADVVGISPDSAARHKKFKTKYDLPLRLLADENKEAANAYGVWVEKSMYGRKYMGVERSTFLIDSKGKIVRSWRKVKIPGHAEDALAAVKALAK